MIRELNIDFSALETMVTVSEYCKVCIRWVPKLLTQEEEEHDKQVCLDLLNQYKAEDGSFQNSILNGDVVSPLHARVKTAVRGVVSCEFHIEKEVQHVVLIG